jgi:hypothetical protein
MARSIALDHTMGAQFLEQTTTLAARVPIHREG